MAPNLYVDITIITRKVVSDTGTPSAVMTTSIAIYVCSLGTPRLTAFVKIKAASSLWSTVKLWTSIYSLFFCNSFKLCTYNSYRAISQNDFRSFGNFEERAVTIFHIFSHIYRTKSNNIIRSSIGWPTSQYSCLDLPNLRCRPILPDLERLMID